jgi:hypothetical protein
VGIRRSRTNYKKKKGRKEKQMKQTEYARWEGRTEDFKGYLREDPTASEDAKVDEGEVQTAADGMK